MGAREVGFTVLSISLSLVAVFIPLLFMGGIVGRLFREFAVTLSVAILISLVVSLTTTPMMCASACSAAGDRNAARCAGARDCLRARRWTSIARTLAWALRQSRLMMAMLLVAVVLNVYLFIIVPKGFFPQQDTGTLIGGMRADQSISFQAMQDKLTQLRRHHPAPIRRWRPWSASPAAGGGRRRTNSGIVFVTLKPPGERKVSSRRR